MTRLRADTVSRRHASTALASALLLAAQPLAPPRALADGNLPSSSIPISSGGANAGEGSKACPPASATFKSIAFDKPNYANAVTASRDTNVSPQEAYDVIASRALPPAGVSCPRALDLGAGAGVSTQLLWLNGFRNIVAVDPSRVAWDSNVGPLPKDSGVTFLQTSDEGYVEQRGADAPLFDLVLVNFAINGDKARELCGLLNEGGRLLAPVNQVKNYFFRQEYRLYDRTFQVLWSTETSGGWAITFQPDFTSPSCQGQWCPQFRGAGDMSTLKLN